MGPMHENSTWTDYKSQLKNVQPYVIIKFWEGCNDGLMIMNDALDFRAILNKDHTLHCLLR